MNVNLLKIIIKTVIKYFKTICPLFFYASIFGGKTTLSNVLQHLDNKMKIKAICRCFFKLNW